MKRAVLVARVLLGLPLVAFGAIGLFRLVEPDPEQFTPEAYAFLEALDATGYLLRLNSLVELACGLAFLTGRFVPLAIVVFAPTMVNILGFHLFLDAPERGVVAYLLLALYLLLAWAHRPAFRGLFAARGELAS